MSHKRSLTRDLTILRRGRLRERNVLNYQVMRARDQRILAGKRDSRRRSTTRFRENVLVKETSYQMLEVYHFRSGLVDHSTKISVPTCRMNKKEL